MLRNFLLALVFAVTGLVDYLMGPSLAFALVYLLPILLAS